MVDHYRASSQRNFQKRRILDLGNMARYKVHFQGTEYSRQEHLVIIRIDQDLDISKIH